MAIQQDLKRTAGAVRAAEGTMALGGMLAPQDPQGQARANTADAMRAAEGTTAAAGMVGKKTDLYHDEGGWSYVDLGDGRIKIASAPSTSKLKPGSIIDPSKIGQMPDGPAKTRAATAYNSIRGVLMGAAPLEPVSAGKKPASKAMPAGGAQPNAARPGELRGGESTPADAAGPGLSPVSPPGAVAVPRPAPGPSRAPFTRMNKVLDGMED